MKKLFNLLLLLVTITVQSQFTVGVISSQEVGSTIPANELYAQDNAASTYTEVNSIGAWTVSGASIVSSATAPEDGSYSLLITNTATGFGSGRWQFQGVSGASYTITIYAKPGIGSDQVFRNWGNFTNFSNVQLDGASVWSSYVLNLTAASTGTCEIRAYSGETGASVGDQLYIDKITVVKN